MAVNTKTPALSGPQFVEAFLEELAWCVERTPGRMISGRPAQIVERVIDCTDRFVGCSEKRIQDLSRQVAMAVRAKGLRYHLRYEPQTDGRIMVAFA